MMRVAGGLVAASQYALPPFVLHRPTTVEEASRHVAAGAVALAGGTDLVAQIREGLAIREVADLSQVRGLAGVSLAGGTLRIGAGTTHAEGAADPALRAALPGLAEAWGRIATARVRFTGTIGGNLMAGRPRYEGRLLFGTLGALLRFADGTTLPAERLAGEASRHRLLTDILIAGPERLLFRYERALRPMMTLALCLRREADGRLSGRAGIATERLAPAFLPLPELRDPAAEAEAAAAAAFAALPRDFADPMSGNAWLRAAGHATLARALKAIAA
ncbi:MAG: FAD binding domain-containing protein [Acetobacteraceae bacterium]|nr:FAD binding domain-containing protein [Acetobacteraceae bacterium]